MEVAAAATASPRANPGGSPAPVAVAARDASRTSRPNSVQPQPAEPVPNGVHVNGVGVDRKGTTSPPTTAPMQESTRPASKASGPVFRVIPETTASRPSPVQAQPAQPPSTLPPSTQPSLTLPPSTLPPSTQPPSAQLRAMDTAPHSQPIYQQQPHSFQHTREAPATTAPSSGPTSPPFQAGQPHGRPRETNGVPRRFASPDSEHEHQIPRFNRDLSLLADAVQQSCPEAARRIVRDKWEKCIMGSEFHHAFLMNAIIHHASGVIMRRAIRDFGQNLVFEAKHEIASHLRPQDLDDIAPEIVKKFSNQFLDKALEYRLGTIDAQSLINALARAERLGYTKSDVIEDRKEIVVPTAQMHSPEVSYASLLSGPGAHPQPPPAAPPQGSLFYQPQPTRNASPTTELKCKLCWRHFKHAKPYEYHVQKQVCTKAAADASNHHFWCEECAAGFTTKAGLQYHTANAVCGSHATAAATPKSQATTPRSAALPPTNYAHHPPSQTQIPPTPPQPYSTPRRPNASSVETPSSSQDDPYGHLTPERRAKLDEDLRLAELSYAPRFREAEDIADPVQRKLKIESLQNTFSTKQSMIRKKYGVRLRVRRTRAAIEEEKLRIGLKHGRGSPGSAVATPPAKRQRSDDASNSTGRAYVSHVPQTQTPLPTPTHPLSVSQMNNSGLNGSSATAATADPTASIVPTQLPSAEEQAPSSSLSSLQRKGYRVSSHVGQATRPASNSPAPRASSAPTPAVVVLDDSSDSTDTDEEIPATLPQKRVS